MDKEIKAKTAQLLNYRLTLVVEDQLAKISRANKEFIKMNQPPLKERVKKWIGLQS